MSGVRISNLPAVASSQITDVFPVVQSGITSQESILQIRNLFGFNSGTGLLSLANGGTNANLTAITNAIVYSNGSAFTLLSPVNSAVLASSSVGLPTWVGSLTNGQLVIGSTGATPVGATLTGSAGITITNGAGSINISGTGGGYGWTTVSGTSQSMASNNGYIANNPALVTLTLPASSAVGDSVIIQGKGTGTFAIAQNSGQTIHFGNANSTTGVGGSVTANNQYNSIEMLCITANTDWAVLGSVGTFTVV